MMDHHGHHTNVSSSTALDTHHAEVGRASSPPLSLAGRSRAAASVRAGLISFRSLIHVTSIGLAAVCFVAIGGGIVLALVIHPALWVVPVLFAAVLVVLVWLSNYAQRIVGYVGVAIEILDYDPSQHIRPEVLIERFKQGFGYNQAQKLKETLHEGHFDVSRGVRQLLYTAVEELLLAKLQTFAYAPALTAAIVGIILLIISYLTRDTWAVYITLLVIGSVLLALSLIVAWLGTVICRATSKQIHRLLSLAQSTTTPPTIDDDGSHVTKSGHHDHHGHGHTNEALFYQQQQQHMQQQQQSQPSSSRSLSPAIGVSVDDAHYQTTAATTSGGSGSDGDRLKQL